MKSILFAVVILFSVSAFARVVDSDPLFRLPEGTSLAVLKVLNFNPYTKYLLIQNGKVFNNINDTEINNPVCGLDFEESSFERILRVGAKVVLKDVVFRDVLLDGWLGRYSPFENRRSTKFNLVQTAGSGRAFFYCLAEIGNKSSSITIGQMKEILKDVIEVGPLPAPVEF